MSSQFIVSCGTKQGCVLAPLLCPARRVGALSDDARLTMSDDVCLSVAYVGPKSTTERPRETKIGTER